MVTHSSTNPEVRGQESNSQPVDHKSDALTTTYKATMVPFSGACIMYLTCYSCLWWLINDDIVCPGSVITATTKHRIFARLPAFRCTTDVSIESCRRPSVVRRLVYDTYWAWRHDTLPPGTYCQVCTLCSSLLLVYCCFSRSVTSITSIFFTDVCLLLASLLTRRKFPRIYCSSVLVSFFLSCIFLSSLHNTPLVFIVTGNKCRVRW